MSFFGKPKGKKYHDRTIEVSSYEYDEHRLVVAGCLTDYLSQEFHLATGETKWPGSGPLHQMIIHLLVNKTTLEIEDIHVEMPAVPYEECLTTMNVMESVKGLKIIGGFTSKVKKLVGGVKGCNHLVALLTAMGPPRHTGIWCQQTAGVSRYYAGYFPDAGQQLPDMARRGGSCRFSKRKIQAERKG
ncbi:MAG: DUF2889 domain-containing protein [Smithellaceae bacterium]